MPSATTLILPEALRARIAPLARQAGKTPHAWMVEALERETALCELREAFLQAGAESAREVDAGGPLYASEDVHSYLPRTSSASPTSWRERTRPALVRRSS